MLLNRSLNKIFQALWADTEDVLELYQIDYVSVLEFAFLIIFIWNVN